MRQRAAVFFLCLAFLLCAAGCGPSKEPAKEQAAVPHHCPMHPQVLKDGPGTCPLCKMDLVPVGRDSGSEEEHAVHVDEAAARGMGLRTRKAETRALAGALRLDGRVVPIEGNVYSVSTRLMAYVHKVHAAVAGQRVRKGEVLVELSGPDVQLGQERVHQARDRLMGQMETIAQARQRLLNWGVPEFFVARVETSRVVYPVYPMVSPAAGVLTRRSVVAGEGVMPGAEMFEVTDLSEVWVAASVYQSDLAWVRKGAKVELTFGHLPGRTFQGSVDFVAPEMDAATRTAELRIKVRNTPDMDLRPEMFAQVTLEGSGPEGLVVPAEALLREGTRDLVVVGLGNGHYVPREVRTGRENGEWVEILEGLEEEDEVVVSAQFLIDSESSLRSAASRVASHGEAHAR